MANHHHQKKTPATVEWTLEHHSIIVDTLLRHGGNEKAAASKVISDEVMKRIKGGLLSRTQMASHVHQFQRMQRRTQQLLDVVNKRAVASLLEGLTMETTDKDSLTKKKRTRSIKPTMSKWTLENHQRLVDALKKLHGGDLVVDKIAPTGKLAVRVLGEMEEERHQGLTLSILIKHLMRLGSLQRETQRAIEEATTTTRDQYVSVWRRLGPRIKTMNYGDADRKAIARILANEVEAARIRSQLRNTPVSSKSDWANLPKHLLDAILERLLTSSDYVRFSMVCMPWFSVAKDNQNIRTKKLSSTHQEPPMLLFFNAIEEAWSLYNILDNKVRDDVQLKMPKKRFCGSSKGWLIVVEEDFAVTLINPFLRSKENGEGDIHLPQLVPPDLDNKPLGRQRWVQDCDYYVVKATLTADPISNADECIVVVIYVERLRMAFTRIGKNMGWTYIDADWCGGIEDVLQLGGDKFCAVMSDKNLVTFNITSESYSDLIEIDCLALPSFESIIRLYLVQSHENDLLLVVRCCDWEDLENLHKRVSEFQVFKFDFDKCQWIEKTLGGDVALFIGENLSISVVASKFPGCKGNCIYYNHDYDYMNKRDLLYDFGVYDMKTKEISKPYSTKLMALLEMIHQRPIWFTPYFCL